MSETKSLCTGTKKRCSVAALPARHVLSGMLLCSQALIADIRHPRSVQRTCSRRGFAAGIIFWKYNCRMKFDPQKHHRRSIRLKGYDYSLAGAYFVTVVAWQREMLFGEIVNEEMTLNQYGKIVLNAWLDLPNHYRHVELGAFIIMSNHAHGVVVLNDDGRGGSSTMSQTILPDGLNARTESAPTQQTRPYVAPKCHLKALDFPLLVDEDVHPDVIVFLREAGLDVESVSEQR